MLCYISDHSLLRFLLYGQIIGSIHKRWQCATFNKTVVWNCRKGHWWWITFHTIGLRNFIQAHWRCIPIYRFVTQWYVIVWADSVQAVCCDKTVSWFCFDVTYNSTSSTVWQVAYKWLSDSLFLLSKAIYESDASTSGDLALFCRFFLLKVKRENV